MNVCAKENPSYHSPAEQNLFAALEDIVITNGDDNSYQINSRVILSVSMPFFSGHFPGAPIFPAVTQLAIVRLLSAKAVEKSLGNVLVGKTKFSGALRPDENIQVKINLKTLSEGYEAIFNFFNGDNLASSGVAKYESINTI